jgi:hypothetical protein
MSTPANEPSSLVTCPCQQCNGLIEFDACRAGEPVTCPHCNSETNLFLAPPVPDTSNLRPVPPTLEEIKKAEIEERIIKIIYQIKTLMKRRLEGGKPVFLYDSLFVPVDSILDEEHLANEFSVGKLRSLGLLGWDVVQAAPKTIGIGLKNMGTDTLFSEKWGGGIGGNVLGVHLIIQKALSASDITDDPTDEIGEFIRNHLSDFLPD